jgi:hypothetical protein
MKRFVFFIFLIQAGFLFIGRVGAESGTVKSVVVLGTSLVLKEEKKTATQYLAEYIPEGETFQNFTKMFAVWGRLDGSDAQFQVKAKTQFVSSRKGKDPVANFNVFQSDDKKMFGLDFLISEGGMMEQNVWSFQNVKGGVLAYQYARRHYEGKSPQTSRFYRIPTCSQVLGFFKTAPLQGLRAINRYWK